MLDKCLDNVKDSSINTEQEGAMGHPPNKQKQKTQSKTTKETQAPATKTAKNNNAAVDELLAKLQPYNLKRSDAETASKYYYNQPDLQHLNPDQLTNLHKRLVARVEAETSAPTPEAAVQTKLELKQAEPVVVVEPPQEANTPEINETKPEAVETTSATAEPSTKEPTMLDLEQASTTTESTPTLETEVRVAEILQETQTSTPVIEALVEIKEPAQNTEVIVVQTTPEPTPEVPVTELAPLITESTIVAPVETAVTEASTEPTPEEVPAVVATPAPEPAPIAAPVVETPVVAEVKEPEAVAAPIVAAPVVAEIKAPEVKEPEPEKEPVKEALPEIMEPRYWRKNGWSAKVIKNEDDDGWAVEISKEGLPDPVLVSPWVMGRDKKNPKPFDSPSFTTFVKTASEVMRRAAQQRERELKKSTNSCWDGIWYKIVLEITPDEFDPYATLTATTDDGEIIKKIRVQPNYKFSQAIIDKWVRGGFKE
jgi:hypothetical protein